MRFIPTRFHAPLDYIVGAALIAAPWIFQFSEHTAATVVPIVLGDIAKVTGAPIGCLVRQQNGERALDCRRTGPLTGRYGTILTPTQVLVVRFQSPKTAKIVFQARHQQPRVHTCGG